MVAMMRSIRIQLADTLTNHLYHHRVNISLEQVNSTPACYIEQLCLECSEGSALNAETS